MRNLTLLLALMLSMTAAVCFAAERDNPGDKAASSESEAQNAIRKSASEFVAAFNKGEPKSIASLWTPDGEYVDESGRVFVGRDAIEKEYAAFFATHPGLTIDISISSIKIIGGESAIEDGVAVIKDKDGTAVSKGAYTAIHLKEGGKWLMASVRERPVSSRSSGPKLGDLGWLIGDWAAEKGSSSVGLSFKWIVEKKFLQLSYEAREKGRLLRSGIQIVGVDPVYGGLVSWSFDSTGGHGQGLWKLMKKGVIIESRGIMADGAPTEATEILSRTKPDSLIWRSVNRSVGGLGLDDTEVTLKRRSK